MLVDANPPPGGAAGFYLPPSRFATLGGRAIFFVESSDDWFYQLTPGPGVMLWATDGTEEGTELLAGYCTDEAAGCQSAPRFLGQLGGVVLFEVSRARWDFDRELWRTDGTREGTFLLQPEVCPGRDPSDDTTVIAGGALFFAGFDAEAGCELWHSDSTAAGTGRVSNLGPGESGSFPHGFAAVGQRVLFTTSLTDGDGLWVTDGTAKGTSRIADLPTVAHVTAVGGRGFFIAAELTGGSSLWTSDGTAAGTRRVRHFAVYAICETEGHDCEPVTTFLRPDGDGVVFVADDGGGSQLWRSDGTPRGTRRLTHIATPARLGYEGWVPDDGAAVRLSESLLLLMTPAGARVRLWASHGGQASALTGCPGGCPIVRSLLVPVPGGKRVVFAGWSGPSKGIELWTSDGTAAGTHLVRDLCAGYCSSAPGNFLVLGDAVYFTTAADDDGPALWRTDGTAAGTVFLGRAAFPASRPPGGAVLGGQGGQVVLGLATGSRVSELWISAGSEASTHPLTTFDRSVSSSDPRFASLGDRVVFTALDVPGGSIWSSDGVTTERLTTASQATGETTAGGFSQPIVAGGRVFTFTTGFDDALISHSHLVTTDGTLTGTRRIADLGDNYVTSSREFGGRLVFEVESGDHQTLSLWSSDGTSAGTAPLLNLPLDGATKLAAAGGFLYFFSFVDAGFSLFRSDGTAAGTASFGNFGLLQSDPEVVAVAGRVFFAINGFLYRQDATTFDVSHFGEIREVSGLTEFDGRLLFFGTAGGDSSQQGLWSTDGTAAGTALLAQLSAQSPIQNPHALSVWPRVDGRLLFRAWDAEHGFELWITDGTAAGTTRLDLAPGSASSFPDNFAVAAGRVWFTANDGVHGRELWVSDGTPTGTHQTMELAPGLFSALPLGVTPAGGNLFFSAYTPLNGREPWVLPLAGVP
jgi:ELWxxDGT repeat protein